MFGNNNPIRFIDPDGMLSQSFIDDLWNKSGSNTTWTNLGDGSFSDGGDKVVKEQEPDQEDPPKFNKIHDPVERIVRFLLIGNRNYTDPETGKKYEIDNDGNLILFQPITGSPDLIGGLKPSTIIRFGKGTNQVYHTFRYIIDAGFKRSDVEGKIIKEIMKNYKNIPNEKLQIGRIVVKGAKIEFNYFKKDGVINIGRITTSK